MDKQNEQSVKTLILKGKAPMIQTYAAQCAWCFKWCKIDTEEEYMEINCKARVDPFVCEDKEGMSCEDGGHLQFDSTKVWIADTPGLPKIPRGFKRSLVLGPGNSTVDDVYYTTPTGAKLRSISETEAFLKANEEYRYTSIGDFNFRLGKVMKEDIFPAEISDSSSPETSDIDN